MGKLIKYYQKYCGTVLSYPKMVIKEYNMQSNIYLSFINDNVNDVIDIHNLHR